MDILILADLHNSLNEHGKAVEVIKRGTRWLQGRASQTYWEGVVDDREYDLPGLETERLGNPRPGRYPLDINARHRLAIARIKLRDEEGKLHAQVILAQDPLDYAPLFLELADTYFGVDMYAEAHPIYEILGTHPATSSIYVLMQTATCLKMSGEMAEAADVFEHILSADSENNEAKMELAGIYEALNNPRRALDLVYEGQSGYDCICCRLSLIWTHD
jgi:general transcription factor 3C polypeptide 3 (transcription factor C subunit 4)